MKDLARRTIKHLLSVLAFYSGFLRIYLYLKRELYSRPDFTILMYHRVMDYECDRENTIQPGMITKRSTFEKQMMFLKRYYNVISLEELISCLKDKNNPPPRTVVISFDDGWKDNYLFAFPVLKRHELPATIFLSTGYINSPEIFWFQIVNLILQQHLLTVEKLKGILKNFNEINSEEKRSILCSLPDEERFIEGLKKLNPQTLERFISQLSKEVKIEAKDIDGRRWMLNWDEIKEMSHSLISFGSHGISHRIMTFLNPTEIKRELAESKKVIEEKINVPVTSFAYPNGDFTTQIKEAVQKTCYLCACAIGKNRNRWDKIDLFELGRIGVHEGMSSGINGKFSKAIFACQIAGLSVKRRKC